MMAICGDGVKGKVEARTDGGIPSQVSVQRTDANLGHRPANILIYLRKARLRYQSVPMETGWRSRFNVEG